MSDPTIAGVRALYRVRDSSGMSFPNSVPGDATATLTGTSGRVETTTGSALQLVPAGPLKLGGAGFFATTATPAGGVSFWFRAAVFDNAIVQLAGESAGTTSVWALSLRTNNGVDTLTLSCKGSTTVILSGSVVPGRWTHVTLALGLAAGVLTATIFVDGALSGQGTLATTTLVTAGSTLLIGPPAAFAANTSASIHVHDVRVYNVAPDAATAGLAMTADAPTLIANAPEVLPRPSGVRALYRVRDGFHVAQPDAFGGRPARPHGTSGATVTSLSNRIDEPAGRVLQMVPGAHLRIGDAGFFTTGGAMTGGLSFWVRVLAAENQLIQLASEYTGGTLVWNLYIHNEKLMLAARGSAIALALGPAPAPGRWTHIGLALSFANGALAVQLCVDGQRTPESGSITSTTFLGGATVLTVGQVGAQTSLGLLHIHDVRVFSEAPAPATLQAAMSTDAPLGLDALRRPAARLPLSGAAEGVSSPPLTDTALAGRAGVRTGTLVGVDDPWFSRCVSLSGAGSRVAAATSVPDKLRAGAGDLAVWSVACWLRPSAEDLAAERTLVYAPTSAAEAALALRVDAQAGGAGLTIWCGTATTQIKFVHAQRALLRPERWTHLAVSVAVGKLDGAGVAARALLFVDGRLCTLTATVTAVAALATALRTLAPTGLVTPGVGLSTTDAMRPSKLRVADLRVYREPLHAAAVAAIMREAEVTNFETFSAYNQRPLIDLPMDRIVSTGSASQLDDASGRSAPAIVDANSTFAAVDDRLMGRALEVFTGGTSIARVALPSWFRAVTGNAITVDVWVKHFLPVGTATSPIIAAINGQSALWRLSAGPSARVEAVGPAAVSLTANQTMVNGQWHHLAFVIQDTVGTLKRTVKLYQDGARVASTVDPGGTIADLAGAGEILLGNVPLAAGEVAFQGRLANLRVFDRALSDAEIAEAYAARRPGPSVTTGHLVEFAVYNDRHEPTLYLLEETQTLGLDIRNASPGDLVLPRLTASADADGHHFELRFRAGVLRNIETITLTGPQNVPASWTIRKRDSAGTDYAVSLFLTATPKDSAAQEIRLPQGATWTFQLGDVQPDPNGGTRGTRTQLQWRNMRSLNGQNLVGTRLHYLSMVHQRKQTSEASFPLRALLVGSPFAPTGAASTNASLKLVIVHAGGAALPMPARPKTETPPTILVTIPESSPGRPDGLIKAGNDPSFRLDSGATRWTVQDEGKVAKLRWREVAGTFLPDEVVSYGAEGGTPPAFERLELTVTGLDPGDVSGLSQVVVRFENFPDIDDASRTLPNIVQWVPVIRAPLYVPETVNADSEALAVGGSLGVWGSSAKLRLHTEAWTSANSGSDTPEITLGPSGTQPVHELYAKVSLVLKAEDANHQIRIRLKEGDDTWDNRIEVREYGDICLTANAIPDAKASWKKSEFMRDGTVNLPGKLTVKSGGLTLESGTPTVTSVSLTVTSGELSVRGGALVTDRPISVKEGATTTTGYPVPPGTIIMWSGRPEQIPTGWGLCDGSLGSPDLRGRFIVGYASTDTDYNAVGKTGGENYHALKVAEMPSHNHTAMANNGGGHQHYWRGFNNVAAGTAKQVRSTGWIGSDNLDAVTSLEENGTHSHTVTVDPAGSGTPHENRPNYYTLCFLCKLRLGAVSLRTANGINYLAMGADNRVVANATAVAANTVFTLERVSSFEVALKASNGKYVTAVGQELWATASSVGTNEKFRMERSPIEYAGKFGFQASSGSWVSAYNQGGGVVNFQPANSAWEAFELIFPYS